MKYLVNIIGGKRNKLVILLFCTIYIGFLGTVFLLKVSPMQNKIPFMKNEINNIGNNTQSFKKSLENKRNEEKNVKKTVNNKIGLFLNDQEIENFYEEVSNLAINNNMTVRSLVRGDIEKITENGDDNNSSDNLVEQFKVGVYYELEGNFKDYLSMRNILANMEKVIIFEQEVIERSTNINNNVLVRANISVPKIVFRENLNE